MPRVAVVIPTRNRASLVLDSVSSVLAQTLKDLEVVVVDDASTDDTLERLNDVSDRRLRIVTHDRPRERSLARNAGIRHTQSKWILFLDDDDLLTPRALERLYAAAEHAGPKCVAAAGRLSTFGRGPPRLERWVMRSWSGSLLRECVLEPIVGPNRAILSSDALNAVGGWAPELPPFEDYALALRMSARGPAALTPHHVLWHRVHANQSDLSDARAAHRGIITAVLPELSASAACAVHRRHSVLEQIWDLHADADQRGLDRAARAVRLMRQDPSVFGSPLSRLTVGLMLMRLAAGGVVRATASKA